MQPRPVTTTRWDIWRVRYHDYQLAENAALNMLPAAVVSHVLVLLLTVAAQRSTPASGDLFAEIFQRGLAKQKSMKSIRASFTETTTSSLLVKPIVGKGTIVAAPPARVRMTYVEPEPK